jgi:phage replication O-like protein O
MILQQTESYVKQEAVEIRPFADPNSKYTMFDNYLLDRIMPEIKPNAWKILCLIIRKTRGWHKESDRISFSQIKRGTGISSDETISNALKQLSAKQYILIEHNEKWQATKYKINTSFTTKIEVEPTTKIEVEPTTKIEDTKERERKGKKDSFANANKTPFSFLELTVDVIKDRIEGFDPDKLRSVMEAEIDGKNRKGLIKFIEARLNGDNQNPDKNPWGDIFKGLADCCEYDTGILSGQDRGELANAARTMLGNGYSLEDIKGFRKWWNTETWKGQKKQPPKLYDVRQEWGRYRRKNNGTSHTSPTLTPEQEAEYRRLQTQQGGI